MNLTTPAVQKTAQGNGLSQQSPTLSDFLGMILSPTEAAAAQQNLPLSQADMKALTEKIAAMLNGKGTENSQAISSGLMQILSAPMATQIQNTESVQPLTEAPAADTDMAKMAQMLSEMEPGTGTNTPAAIDMDAEISALLAQSAATPATTPDDMATAIAKKIAALLQQQGTDTAKAAQAAATPAVTGGQGLATLQNILQLQGEQPQHTPAHHSLRNAAQADDAPLPAPQAQQPAAEAKTDGRSLPQMPAITGQNTQNGGMQNGFGQNGFGQNGFGNNGFSFFASADGSMMTTDTGGAQNVTQNFAQYNAQATAQTLPAQTTQMIALQIQRNAATRVDSFTLQLDPADLGRLDVELKFHRDGSIQAHLSADRPETLAMLQKDSAHLERILQQAGFDTKDGSLSFDLRQQSDGNNADGTGKKRAGAGGIGNTNNIDNNEAAQNAAAESRLSGYIGLQGVNIMV
jgi:flagellar hook-length control protein FliK